MARVTVADVQAWLNDTIIELSDGTMQDSAGNTIPTDPLLEAEYVETSVLDRLEKRFDTSEWVDRDTTPRLVRIIIAQLIAVWRIRSRVGLTKNDDSEYADELEQEAWGRGGDGGTLGDIMAGRVVLPGSRRVALTTDSPANVANLTGYGTKMTEQTPAFTMGMSF